MTVKIKNRTNRSPESRGYKLGFDSFVAGLSSEDAKGLAAKQGFTGRALGLVSTGWINAQRRTEQHSLRDGEILDENSA